MMILLKTTLVLAIGLTAVWSLRRARAALRHLLLTATFAALLVIPAVDLAGFAVLVEVPAVVSRVFRPHVTSARPSGTGRASSGVQAPPIDASFGDGSRQSDTASTPPLPTVLMTIWGLVAAGSLLKLGFDLGVLRNIRRNAFPSRDVAKRVGVFTNAASRPEVLLSEHLQAPLVCGVLQPAVVLPLAAAGWSDEDLRRALVHEMEHVRRGDWPIQLLTRMVCAIYWFHPLVWVAWRRLLVDAERACDDAVIGAGEATDYADQLVALARRQEYAHGSVVLGMAGRSDLSIRIRALLNPTVARGRVSRATAIGATAAAMVVTLAIAPIRAVNAASSGALATAPESASPLDLALLEAASRGDVASVAVLIGRGANVNAAIGGEGSSLIAAARQGQLDAVAALLNHGADPNLAVSRDGSPLIAAAREGHLAVATLLLDRGADVDAIVPGDENAIIGASVEGHVEVVRYLVSRGADVNARAWVGPGTGRPDGEWRTPLNMAGRRGYTQVVDYLRSVGARQ